MKTIKFLLVALFVTALATISSAQSSSGPKSDDKKPTLNGDWEITVAAPTGAMPVTGTIKQDGQNLSGKLTTPLGPGEITSGSVTGNQFKFVVAVRGQGNRFDATMNGTLDGNNMKGSVDTPQGTFDFMGSRKGNASATTTASGSSSSSPMAAGNWVLTVTTPNGDVQVNLSLKQDGENVTGTVSSQFGQSDITNGKFSGGKFTFPVTISANGDSVALTFNGVIEGDTMKGSIESSMGSFDFTGTRQKQ